MTKRILLFVLLLPLYLHAQVSDVVFVGTVTTNDGQNFSYKLQFSDFNGHISGYSVTDIMGPNETKTLVTGTINSSQKLIKFKETRVLRSKVNLSAPGNELCFMNATLKASNHKGSTVLKGTFKGYTDKNVECSAGKVMLVSAKDVMAKLMKTDLKKDSATLGKALAADDREVINTEPIKDLPITNITPGTTHEFSVEGNTAVISVWDASYVDGDMITILHNGKVVLSSYVLKAQSTDITIKLTGNDVIQVVANNEGSEPFNTARMKIRTNRQTYIIDASTTVDKPVSVILKGTK